jgi:hypothetical protein
VREQQQKEKNEKSRKGEKGAKILIAQQIKSVGSQQG